MWQRKWLMAGTVVLIAFAALLMYRVSARADEDRVAIPRKDAPPASALVSAAHVAPPQSAAAALPPAGTPVLDFFDGLKKRADAGDARAACRLAVELIRCRTSAETTSRGGLDQMRELEEGFAKDEKLVAADWLAARQLRHIEATQRCSGVTETQHRLAGHYLQQAARSGINEALVRFADGQGFHSTQSMYGVLQEPQFEQWRRDAPGFVQQALAQGEPAATQLLIMAYSDDNSLFAGLVRDDPVAFRAQRLLQARLRGSPVTVATNLDPQQEGQAQAQAARMHRAYFDSAVVPKEKSLLAALDLHDDFQEGRAPAVECQ